MLGSGREVPVREADNNLAPLVETVSVEAHEGGFDIEVSGLVVPFREIEISAEVAGRVVHKAEISRPGNYITQGTLLVEIDPRDYELEVLRLTKELGQADVDLEEIEVDITNTEALVKLADEEVSLERKELKRLEELAQTRVVSESELDQGRRNELTARNALQTVQNRLQLLRTHRRRLERASELVEAKLEKAKLQLTRTKISAPVDGVIVEDSVEQGAYVQKGTSLMMLEDTSAVEVKCSLRMEELDWIWRQQAAGYGGGGAGGAFLGYQLPKTPVTVIYDLAGRQYTWNGVLSRYDGLGVDERTRTVPCRVVVDDPRAVTARDPLRPAGPAALMRGMYVTVEIHVQPQTELLRIPQEAVRPGNKVWRVHQGQLALEEVEVVRVSELGVLVNAEQSDLAAGDKVVVSPLALARPGMKVKERTSP